jgi:hypothetical protein
MAQPPQQTAPAAQQAVVPPNSKDAAAKREALKVAVSHGEVIMLLILVLLGMGVWVLADRFANSYAKEWEPREEEFQLRRGLPRLQAGLAMRQDERKSTQEQLIKMRLELADRESALGALEAFPPPTPENPSATSNATPTAGQRATPTEKPAESKPAAPSPAEVRAEAFRKRDAAERLVNSLSRRFDTLQTEADRFAAETEQARRDVAADFYRSQWNFRMLKALATLAAAAFVLFLLVAFISWLRRAKRGQVPGVSDDGSLMWWTLAGLVLILFGYQALEIAGAALAAVFVILVILARVPWQARLAAAKAEAAKAGAEGGA